MREFLLVGSEHIQQMLSLDNYSFCADTGSTMTDLWSQPEVHYLVAANQHRPIIGHVA